jgi:hypothetical protein
MEVFMGKSYNCGFFHGGITMIIDNVETDVIVALENEHDYWDSFVAVEECTSNKDGTTKAAIRIIWHRLPEPHHQVRLALTYDQVKILCKGLLDVLDRWKDEHEKEVSEIRANWTGGDC